MDVANPNPVRCRRTDLARQLRRLVRRRASVSLELRKGPVDVFGMLADGDKQPVGLRGLVGKAGHFDMIS